jgi:tetratricopeptide (TPR) repeat protein
MGRTDQHDNPMTADADGVALYDQAMDAYLRYSPAVLDLAGKIGAEQPDMPMGQALLAYLYLTSSDAPDVAIAREAAAAMSAVPLNEREAAHHRAITTWVNGDWTGAASALDDVLLRWPTDLLALQVGHVLDFYIGDAGNLRDRPGRTLPELDPDHPHTGFVRGMQAFGLEESGDYGAAEAAGQAAIATNPDDVWAIHALTHVREMQGRIDDGIRFLVQRKADWGSGNLFTVHNWWHLGLYLMEAGAVDDALAIYDAEIHNASSAGVPLEMLDASAFLWRLFLEGEDTGARFDALADAWASRAQASASSWYVFNEVHAVMALVGAGRLAEAEQVIEGLAGYVHRNGGGTNVMMASQIGLPASRALLRFAQGRHDDVIAELAPIRRVFNRFGGSHAQRDVLVRTVTESAVRTGNLDLARGLVAERLSLRDTSVYGWTQMARMKRQEVGRPLPSRPRPRQPATASGSRARGRRLRR